MKAMMVIEAAFAIENHPLRPVRFRGREHEHPLRAEGCVTGKKRTGGNRAVMPEIRIADQDHLPGRIVPLDHLHVAASDIQDRQQEGEPAVDQGAAVFPCHPKFAGDPAAFLHPLAQPISGQADNPSGRLGVRKTGRVFPRKPTISGGGWSRPARRPTRFGGSGDYTGITGAGASISLPRKLFRQSRA